MRTRSQGQDPRNVAGQMGCAAIVELLDAVTMSAAERRAKWEIPRLVNTTRQGEYAELERLFDVLACGDVNRVSLHCRN